MSNCSRQTLPLDTKQYATVGGKSPSPSLRQPGPMPKDGSRTRRRIMDAAIPLILERGFAGTSVDAIVAAAGVTKGAFFHHFATKTDLAHEVVDRWVTEDAQFLEEMMGRAERLAREPLEQLLLFVGLFEESMAELSEPYPGCLMASMVYESGLIDEATHARIQDSVLAWRGRIRAKLEEVAARRSPGMEVDLDVVADQMWTLAEGAIILSKTMRDPRPLATQMRQYRNYLELLFDGT